MLLQKGSILFFQRTNVFLKEQEGDWSGFEKSKADSLSNEDEKSAYNGESWDDSALRWEFFSAFRGNAILTEIVEKITDMKKKIVIATGGTGGHIYPALALAQIWKEQEPDTEIVFAGNDNRMEADLIPEAGYRFLPLHASGLTGGLVHKVKAVVQMLQTRKKAKAYLQQEKPDLVIGFGGYVSAPVLMAAHSLHIPVLMHEQNSVVGKSNKVAAGDAGGIVICYEKAAQVFDPEKTRMLGNPRASLAARAQKDEAYFRSLGLDPSRKTILVVMGSLGSSSVNELMEKALRDLDESLQILYVCGKDNAEDLHRFDHLPNVHAVEYVDTMRLYRMLDGIICRAGATTLAEVTALGIPAVIIPSPYVTANHQYYNAKMLEERHAAVMIEEKDLNAEALKKAVETAFLDEENRKQLAEGAKKAGKPQAAQDMIAFGNELIASHRKTG